VRSTLVVYLLLTVLIAVGSGVAWWASGLDHADVAAFLAGQAPDGRVESYTTAFHTRIVQALRLLAYLLAALVPIALFLLPRLRHAPGLRSAWHEHVQLLVRGLHRVRKESSRAHQRLFFALVVIGVGLRVWAMSLPVMYDEAFTYTYYATRPWYVVLAEYSYPNNHILHTLLVKLSTGVFGVNLWALRLPAFLAGLLTLPLFYLFVRSFFNRYIALIALALIASHGGLVEYGALARGYSLTWVFLLVGLLLGRQLLRDARPFTALLLGLTCALGMWTIPTMLYGVAFLHLWLLFTGIPKPSAERSALYQAILLSALIALVSTLLLYAPVLVVYGPGQVLHHSSMPTATWAEFTGRVVDEALHIWTDLGSTTGAVVGLLGMAAVISAAALSAKYRALVAALLVSALGIVLLQAMVAPPRVWLYALFILHLGTAISLFQLLKFLEQRVLPALSKRDRTTWAVLLIAIGFGAATLITLPGRLPRYPEARAVAAYLLRNAGSSDRAWVRFPWEAPVEFECLAAGGDRGLLYRSPVEGATVHIVVGKREFQTWQEVAVHHGSAVEHLHGVHMVEDRPATAIFAARYGP
jgi:hypothetical protein